MTTVKPSGIAMPATMSPERCTRSLSPALPMRSLKRPSPRASLAAANIDTRASMSIIEAAAI